MRRQKLVSVCRLFCQGHTHRILGKFCTPPAASSLHPEPCSTETDAVARRPDRWPSTQRRCNRSYRWELQACFHFRPSQGHGSNSNQTHPDRAAGHAVDRTSPIVLTSSPLVRPERLLRSIRFDETRQYCNSLIQILLANGNVLQELPVLTDATRNGSTGLKPKRETYWPVVSFHSHGRTSSAIRLGEGASKLVQKSHPAVGSSSGSTWEDLHKVPSQRPKCIRYLQTPESFLEAPRLNS